MVTEQYFIMLYKLTFDRYHKTNIHDKGADQSGVLFVGWFVFWYQRRVYIYTNIKHVFSSGS